MKYLTILLALVCVGCDQQPDPPKLIRRHDLADIGDAPAIRITELDDGTRFVAIGKHSQTEHMLVLIKRAGSDRYDIIRGSDVPTEVEVAP